MDKKMFKIGQGKFLEKNEEQNIRFKRTNHSSKVDINDQYNNISTLRY